jgi:hypothetical protein
MQDSATREEGAEQCSLCMYRPVDVALECKHAMCKLCLLMLCEPTCPQCRRATVESAQMAVLLPGRPEFAGMCMKVALDNNTEERFPKELEAAQQVWSGVEVGETRTLLQDGVYGVYLQKFPANNDVGLLVRVKSILKVHGQHEVQYESSTSAPPASVWRLVQVYNLLIEAVRQLRMHALQVPTVPPFQC